MNAENGCVAFNGAEATMVESMEAVGKMIMSGKQLQSCYLLGWHNSNIRKQKHQDAGGWSWCHSLSFLAM